MIVFCKRLTLHLALVFSFCVQNSSSFSSLERSMLPAESETCCFLERKGSRGSFCCMSMTQLLKVLTYNVNFQLAHHPTQASQALEAIISSDADIVCLQEITPLWEQIIREESRILSKYRKMYFKHFSGSEGLLYCPSGI